VPLSASERQSGAFLGVVRHTPELRLRGAMAYTLLPWWKYHTMCDKLPSSVRYVKNGRRSRWWHAAQANGQIHLGWKSIPNEILLKADFSAIEQVLKVQYGSRPGATQDCNALRDLLDAPSQHLWVTFEDGFLWWCTVHDGITANPNGETVEEGHFWLKCDRHWSNTSVNGKLLAMSDLLGTITATAGFRATVCTPRGWHSILRLIKDETDEDARKAAELRHEYELAVNNVVKRLPPKDFEHLIDLILARTGWDRISNLGKTQEGIDLEAENPTAAEIAFVQVKSTANQKVLDDYVERFSKRRERYARMIFAVHSPSGKLTVPSGIPVQLWTGERVSELVVRLGLGKWVESRLA